MSIINDDMELIAREIQNTVSWKNFWKATAFVAGAVTVGIAISFGIGILPIDIGGMVNLVMAAVTTASSAYQANSYEQDSLIKTERFTKEIEKGEKEVEKDGIILELKKEVDTLKGQQEQTDVELMKHEMKTVIAEDTHHTPPQPQGTLTLVTEAGATHPETTPALDAPSLNTIEPLTTLPTYTIDTAASLGSVKAPQLSTGITQ